jgi:YHS domain-containing protein
MAGKADHTSQFGPYALHLCSKACKKSFDADPEQAVLNTKLPAPPE